MARHPWATIALWLGALAALSVPTFLERGPDVESAAVLFVMAAAGALFGVFWAVSAARRVRWERRHRRDRPTRSSRGGPQPPV